MSKRYIIWDKSSDVYTPSGAKFTADQWIERYSWIDMPTAIPILSAGLFNGALIDELSQLKARCEQNGATFDEGLDNQALLDAIEAWEDAQAEAAKQAAEEAAAVPTEGERIAAALEYQNLLAM